MSSNTERFLDIIEGLLQAIRSEIRESSAKPDKRKMGWTPERRAKYLETRKKNLQKKKRPSSKPPAQ